MIRIIKILHSITSNVLFPVVSPTPEPEPEPGELPTPLPFAPLPFPKDANKL